VGVAFSNWNRDLEEFGTPEPPPKISFTLEEIESLRFPQMPEPAQHLAAGLRDALRSAEGKRKESDLSDLERVALAYHAGVPCSTVPKEEPNRYGSWHPEFERSARGYLITLRTINPCGFYHDGDKWVVVTNPQL